MRVPASASAAVLLVLLAGCGTSGTTESSSPSVAPSVVSLELAFPEAQGPRVPEPEELYGKWQVSQPVEPPAGGWTSAYAPVHFESGATEEPWTPKEFIDRGIVSLYSPTMSTSIECNQGSGAVAVTADGVFGTDPRGWVTTLVGCPEDAEFPYSFFGKIDRIAIDSTGNLWFSNSDGTFKLENSASPR